MEIDSLGRTVEVYEIISSSRSLGNAKLYHNQLDAVISKCFASIRPLNSLAIRTLALYFCVQ